MQEFFELKLWNMTMDGYERKFLELLRYVSFIRNEKVKIQRFLSEQSHNVHSILKEFSAII
jgi:hypothetical protein